MSLVTFEGGSCSKRFFFGNSLVAFLISEMDKASVFYVLVVGDCAGA
jgi:hypothetical protein